jgi:hypothetical protein
VSLYRIARDTKDIGHLQVGAGRQQLEHANLGRGQRIGELTAGWGRVRLGGARIQARADQLLDEGIPLR